MRKPTVILLCLMLVLTVFLMTACQGGGEPAAQEPDETTEPAEPAKGARSPLSRQKLRNLSLNSPLRFLRD